MTGPEVTAAMNADWDPDKCACRWGEQPCWMCLPVLDARFKARMSDNMRMANLKAVAQAIHNAEKGATT